MKKNLTIFLSIVFALVIGFNVFAAENKTPATNMPHQNDTPNCEIDISDPQPAKTTEKESKEAPVVLLTNLINPITVVKTPSSYVGKRINVSAKFNKFSTLGLDYKPAMRSSDTYITFLIFRTDTDKKIPLSEMKLFIKRNLAEKYIELKEGDNIQFSGIVFSNALGDVWVDVDKLDKLK